MRFYKGTLFQPLQIEYFGSTFTCIPDHNCNLSSFAGRTRGLHWPKIAYTILYLYAQVN